VGGEARMCEKPPIYILQEESHTFALDKTTAQNASNTPSPADEQEPVTVLSASTSPHSVLSIEEDGVNARLDAVPLGLPALMDALQENGTFTKADRTRHLGRFRLDRGDLADRERQTLSRIAAEIGQDALTRAARSAAASKLGLIAPRAPSFHRPLSAAA
jgi:hypothetical protein